MIAICHPEFMYALCRMSAPTWHTNKDWLALNDQMTRLRSIAEFDEVWQLVKQVHGEASTRRRR